MRPLILMAVVAVAGGASAQTIVPAAPVAVAPAAAAPAPVAASPEPLAVTAPALEVEPPKVELTSLETEACRRLILEETAGPKPGGAEIAGATVGGVAGQAAGATVAGPLGAAVGGLVVGKMGQGVMGVARKVFGGDDKAGDRSQPANGMPDPGLIAECDARNPELRTALTPKPKK